MVPNPFRATPVEEVRHKSQASSGVTLSGTKWSVRVSFPLSNIIRRLTAESRPSRRAYGPPQGDARGQKKRAAACEGMHDADEKERGRTAGGILTRPGTRPKTGVLRPRHRILQVAHSILLYSPVCSCLFPSAPARYRLLLPATEGDGSNFRDYSCPVNRNAADPTF